MPLSMILEKDAYFFESVEMMDYSLLLAEIENPLKIQQQLDDGEISN